MKLVVRGLLTIGSVLAYGLINFLLNPVATLAAGKVAAKQFEESDESYVVAHFGMNFFGSIGIPFFVLLVVLMLVWWKPGKAAFDKLSLLVLLAAIAAAAAVVPDSAYAYYDKTNYAEAYFILPNESAFYIPDAGANKGSQAKFDSEQYFNESKIAAKRFEIPHVKFTGSGAWNDYYVPAGRLIIVDRTPYNREWTKDHTRGSSTRNEAIPCQSSEGLDVTLELSVGATVLPDNAAKFLYYFGVTPPAGDRSAPAVVFASVYHGRSLSEVMDSVGRGKVQQLVCAEFTSRTLDTANAEATKIMAAVQAGAKTFFESRGITLDYIGWAGTFTFSDKVQKAIDDKYIAGKVADSVPTLQKMADIMVKEGLAEGLRKGLPSFLPPALGDWFGSIFKQGSSAPSTAPVGAPAAKK